MGVIHHCQSRQLDTQQDIFRKLISIVISNHGKDKKQNVGDDWVGVELDQGGSGIGTGWGGSEVGNRVR